MIIHFHSDRKTKALSNESFKTLLALKPLAEGRMFTYILNYPLNYYLKITEPDHTGLRGAYNKYTLTRCMWLCII